MEDAKEEKGRQPGATGTFIAQVLEENRSLAELNREELNNATHTHRTKTISPTGWTVKDDLVFKDFTTKKKERMRPHSFGTAPYSRE
jgi:hypothetical protein